MAGQGSQISDHETSESSGSVTVSEQNASYRASIPRTTHELYVSRDFVSQEPRSARSLNTTYQIADEDARYADNYTYSSPGIERIVHGVDTLSLSATFESDDTNGSFAKRAANINTKTTRIDKATSGCSVKDRLLSEETPSSVHQLQAPRKHQTLADRRQSGRISQQTESDKDTKYDLEKSQKSCIRIEDRPSSVVEVADSQLLEITLDIKSNSSSLNHPSQNGKDKLDIRILDQAAQKRSNALGAGSWSSDEDASQINTPTSSTGASDKEDPQTPYFLLDRSNSLIRSAAGLSNGSKKNLPQSSNTGHTSGQASGQGGSEGTQNWPTENRENEDLEGDSEEDEKDEPNSTKKRKRIGTGGRKFACPFFKHDPEFHTTSEEDILRYRSCVLGPGWPGIPRLKEHIRRVHTVPITCLRCQKIFDKQDHLVSHQREATECKIQPISPSNCRMTAAKEEELKKKHHGTKYNDVYRILFPNEPCPLSPYYHDGSINSFQDFALEKMLLLLETQLDPVIASYSLDGAQKMSLKNDMKKVATLCQKQILEEYKKGTSNTAASHVSSETDKDFDSMDTGLSTGVANYLPPSNDPSSSNWPPGFPHPVGLSLASMTKGPGALDSSSPGPQSLGLQTPNNPRTSMSVNGEPFWGPYTSSSSSSAAQSGSEVPSMAIDEFVDANYESYDPSLYAARKSHLYPHGSVFPNGSPIPQRIFKTPYLRTRNKTSSTQPSLTPGMETRQRVPSHPQYPSNVYRQASKEQFNANYVISPPSQTPYVQMPANGLFPPQFPGNNYNQGLGDQYRAPENPPPPPFAMGHIETSQNASFQPPFPENYFFPDPNFDPCPYHPPNPQ